MLYIVWAVACFDPSGNPVDGVGFDSFIAMPVASVYSDASARLDSVQTETARERVLAWRLHLLLNFSAGIFLLAFRVILGLLLALLGFATLTVMIERGRLLSILEALQAQDGSTPETDLPSLTS